jgi:hypothetical protein
MYSLGHGEIRHEALRKTKGAKNAIDVYGSGDTDKPFNQGWPCGEKAVS